MEVKNLMVSYPSATLHKDSKDSIVVSDVSFSLNKGEILGIVGESGAGKSSVGNAILLALKNGGNLQGQILFAGSDITDLSEKEQRKLRGKDIGVITQEPFSSLNPIISIEGHFLETLQKLEEQHGRERTGRRGQQETAHKSKIAAEKSAQKFTRKFSRAEKMQKIFRALEEVELPAEREFLARYPFQISGGQCQRVIIALALLLSPKILVADEPTTALDVFVQAQILELLKKIIATHDMAMILITHNMGVVYQVADKILVMQDAKIVEMQSPQKLFSSPEEEYTKNLIKSLPPKDCTVDSLYSNRNWATQKERELLNSLGLMDAQRARVPEIDSSIHISGAQKIANTQVANTQVASERTHILSCEDISFGVDASLSAKDIFSHYARRIKGSFLKSARIQNVSEDLAEQIPPNPQLQAEKKLAYQKTILSNISLYIKDGMSLGLIGASGSGKSTLARVICGLYTRPRGVRFEGRVLGSREICTDIQMIFQSPYASLNPRKKLGEIWAEVVKIRNPYFSKKDIEKKCKLMLELIALESGSLNKYPQAFSGGQLQRICIARVLLLSPKLILCDEPTSALDISVQADILNLLKYIQKECKISMLFISHDLPVVRYMCDDIAVISEGRIIEVQDRERLFSAPQQEYTKQLLDLIPSIPVLKK